MSKWKNTGGLTGNQILKGDGFYISYASAAGLRMMGDFLSGDGSGETALCANDKYYILNGDYREQYEPLVPKGLDACMAFFRENKKNASSWSNE